MCQKSTREVPLQLIVDSMLKLTGQVKENSVRSRGFLSEADSGINVALINVEQSAAQLEHQLEALLQILEEGNQQEKPSSSQTTITFFE